MENLIFGLFMKKSVEIIDFGKIKGNFLEIVNFVRKTSRFQIEVIKSDVLRPQPRRSDQTSDLKFMAQTAYAPMLFELFYL